jgi:hypothetical protein
MLAEDVGAWFVATREAENILLYIFWRARVCWPLLSLSRPFYIFFKCLDSNQRAAIASSRAMTT